jgi:hypothetical protein
MNNGISLEVTTTVRRNEAGFLANQLGEELVMMNMRTGDFVAMNNVGADIWKLLEQPMTMAELVDKLQGLYDISGPQCMHDTMQFLLSTAGQDIFIFANPVSA